MQHMDYDINFLMKQQWTQKIKTLLGTCGFAEELCDRTVTSAFMKLPVLVKHFSGNSEFCVLF